MRAVFICDLQRRGVEKRVPSRQPYTGRGDKGDKGADRQGNIKKHVLHLRWCAAESRIIDVSCFPGALDNGQCPP